MHTDDRRTLPGQRAQRRLKGGEPHEPSRLFIGGECSLQGGAVCNKCEARRDRRCGETEGPKDRRGLW